MTRLNAFASVVLPAGTMRIEQISAFYGPRLVLKARGALPEQVGPPIATMINRVESGIIE